MILPAERTKLFNTSEPFNLIVNLPGTMADQPQASAAEVDFSEFLWMENEEEFDTEVLRELEEEDMINYYYELYEESLNNESNGMPSNSGGSGSGQGSSSTVQPNQPNRHASSTHPHTNPVDDLSRDVSRLTFSSLNPNAVEFVPRGFGGSSSVANNVGNVSGPSSSSSTGSTSNKASTTSTEKSIGNDTSKSSH